MFRLDEDRVVDATLSGGLARYINHSCNPNCVTEIVEVDREFRIIIFAKRRINRGEEVSFKLERFIWVTFPNKLLFIIRLLSVIVRLQVQYRGWRTQDILHVRGTKLQEVDELNQVVVVVRIYGERDEMTHVPSR